MKVLIEVIIISLLIIVGWRQPFRQHVARILSDEKAADLGLDEEEFRIARPRGSTAPAPVTPRDTSWMWQRKTLDSPEH